MKCRKKRNCSQLWPAILSTRETLAKGLCFKVGTGNSINIWEDPWLPDTPGFKLNPRNTDMILRQGIVQQLKNPSGEWNISLINELFTHELAIIIYLQYFLGK